MNLKAQFSWLYQEIIKLVIEPVRFWKEKKVHGFSDTTFTTLFLSMVVAVGFAVSLGELIWNSEIVWSIIISKGLREAISYLIQFYISVFVLKALLNNFQGTSQVDLLQNVLIYTMLPFMLASIITGLFPGLYILGVVGLYGFYIFVLGAQYCLDIPKKNQSRFIILSILLIVFIFGTVNAISWTILKAFFPYGA